MPMPLRLEDIDANPGMEWTGDELYRKTGTHFSHPDSVAAYLHRSVMPEIIEQPLKDRKEPFSPIFKDEVGYWHGPITKGISDYVESDYSAGNFPKDTIAGDWHGHVIAKGNKPHSGLDIQMSQRGGSPSYVSAPDGLFRHNPKHISDNLRIAQSEANPIINKAKEIERNNPYNYKSLPEYQEQADKYLEVLKKHGITNEMLTEMNKIDFNQVSDSTKTILSDSIPDKSSRFDKFIFKHFR